MKSPKVEDLKFEAVPAFERLRKLARGVLTVSKKESEEKSPSGRQHRITRAKRQH